MHDNHCAMKNKRWIIIKERVIFYMRKKNTQYEHNSTQKSIGIGSGVFLAYSIILLHALLIALLFILVLLFNGIINHLLIIILACILMSLLAVYIFYKRIRKNADKLKDILNDPTFQGRSFEIRLLGGAASIRVGQQTGTFISAIDYEPSSELLKLESPTASSVNQLSQLATLLEKGLISDEEYQQMKQNLLNESIQLE